MYVLVQKFVLADWLWTLGVIQTIMTKKRLSQTPNQPCISVFYTLTKIHKKSSRTTDNLISGCEGPTQRMSSFTVDNKLQPIAKTQTSYLKDTTDIIKFIESNKVPENIILVSMNVSQACILRDTGIENATRTGLRSGSQQNILGSLRNEDGNLNENATKQ